MWKCRDCNEVHPGHFRGCPITLKTRQEAEDSTQPEPEDETVSQLLAESTVLISRLPGDLTEGVFTTVLPGGPTEVPNLKQQTSVCTVLDHHGSELERLLVEAVQRGASPVAGALRSLILDLGNSLPQATDTQVRMEAEDSDTIRNSNNDRAPGPQQEEG